jgi:type I restriction enzyme S subunit
MSNTYPSYSTVNFKWAKQFPSHWSIKRLKSIFAMRKESNNPVITNNVLSLTAKQGVVPYAEKTDKGGNRPKEDFSKYNIAHENDLLVNCMNVVSGAAGVSKYFGAISPVYYALYPREDANVWYYHHIFRLLTFQRSLIGLGKGILMHESDTGTLTTVRMRISMDSLGCVMLPVPPRDEQDQIVRFLDWKVSEINRLINIKHKEIAALEELKQSRILAIVTHGVDEKAEMVDSGFEHIGLVPKHWKVLLNHRIYKENSRPFSGDEIVLSLSQKDGLLPYVDMKERSLHTSSYENWKLVFPNDLVLNRFKAHLGVFFSSNYRGIVTFHYGVYEPVMKLSSKYYELLYHTPKYKQVFAGASNGMTVGLQNLSNTNFYKVYTVYPPYDEQCAIVKEAEKIEKEIQAIIATVSSEIDRLHEFRTRLISDVVTGKIDVRGIEIPEYEYTTEEADMDSEAEDDEMEEGDDEV